MARIDDYRKSLKLAAAELKSVDLQHQAERAGADFSTLESGEVEIRLDFLGSPYLVGISDKVDVHKAGSADEVPLPEKILICHYLLHASGEPPRGELIDFRQIPDGRFYFSAFQRRTRDPLLATFGGAPQLFRDCARELGGKKIEAGDLGFAFQVLPCISIHLVLWLGDDEFPSDAGILFDAGIRNSLAAEDIVVLSGMLVYRLMGIAGKRNAIGR
ncbi:MAG: DUF3786 domain-containing protein [Syntrophobacteraceae bacterium]